MSSRFGSLAGLLRALARAPARFPAGHAGDLGDDGPLDSPRVLEILRRRAEARAGAPGEGLRPPDVTET
jgi:hypothetical protein